MKTLMPIQRFFVAFLFLAALSGFADRAFAQDNDANLLACEEACINDQEANDECIPYLSFTECVSRKAECRNLTETQVGVMLDMCNLCSGTCKPTFPKASPTVEAPKTDAPKRPRPQMTPEQKCKKDGGSWVQTPNGPKCLRFQDVEDRLNNLERVPPPPPLPIAPAPPLVQKDCGDCAKAGQKADRNSGRLDKLEPEVGKNTAFRERMESMGMDDMPSLFMVAGRFSGHLFETPEYGDRVFMAGGSVRWMPRIAPRLRLSLEGFVGASSEVATSSRLVMSPSLGMMAHVHPYILFGGFVRGSFFFLDSEDSVLNSYVMGPSILIVPALDRKKPGTIVFAFGGEVGLGFDRMRTPNQGMRQPFQIEPALTAGFMF